MQSREDGRVQFPATLTICSTDFQARPDVLNFLISVERSRGYNFKLLTRALRLLGDNILLLVVNFECRQQQL